jgi:uncharacterized RDD family membrane protein YckC
LSGSTWPIGSAAPETPVVLQQPAAAASAFAGEPAYSGLVTRAIGMTIDAAIVNGVALIVAAAAALIISILPGSQKLHGLEVAIATAVYLLWWIGYFTVFWSTTGQTPGDRVMHIRVSRPDGARLHAVRAMLRLGATVLAAIPLFAGFLPILFNERRRAFNDWLADTVVTAADPPQVATAAVRTHVVLDRDVPGPPAAA